VEEEGYLIFSRLIMQSCQNGVVGPFLLENLPIVHQMFRVTYQRRRRLDAGQRFRRRWRRRLTVLIAVA
jgi:hypothetical protein